MSDERTSDERILFARGVLDILKGTGLFNFLIEQAIQDLDAVAESLKNSHQTNP